MRVSCENTCLHKHEHTSIYLRSDYSSKDASSSDEGICRIEGKPCEPPHKSYVQMLHCETNLFLVRLGNHLLHRQTNLFLIILILVSHHGGWVVRRGRCITLRVHMHVSRRVPACGCPKYVAWEPPGNVSRGGHVVWEPLQRLPIVTHLCTLRTHGTMSKSSPSSIVSLPFNFSPL